MINMYFLTLRAWQAEGQVDWAQYRALREDVDVHTYLNGDQCVREWRTLGRVTQLRHLLD